ncbi:Hym1p [Elasticomyces elasticus]|nr:Hym1p [Elasticomyces elasticus]
MAFFFNRGRSRQPADIVRSTKELLLRIHDSQNAPKAEEELAKQLSQMKVMVQGTQGQPLRNRNSSQ